MAELLGRLLRTPQGSIGLALVLIVLAVALGGPELAPHNPEALSPLRHYRPPGGEYLLGTDQPGRDILSRLLAGARATVLLALLATFVGTIAGAVIGTASAFLSGRVDEAVMRTVDAIMAMPSLLLSLLIVSVPGRGAENAVLAIAIAFTPGMAHITRSAALSMRQQDYVNAAVARGRAPATSWPGRCCPTWWPRSSWR